MWSLRQTWLRVAWVSINIMTETQVDLDVMTSLIKRLFYASCSRIVWGVVVVASSNVNDTVTDARATLGRETDADRRKKQRKRKRKRT